MLVFSVIIPSTALEPLPEVHCIVPEISVGIQPAGALKPNARAFADLISIEVVPFTGL